MAKASLATTAVNYDPPESEGPEDRITFHVDSLPMAVALRVRALMEGIGPQTDELTPEQHEAFTGIAVTCCLDWDGIEGPDGNPAECTETNKRRFFSKVRREIMPT